MIPRDGNLRSTAFVCAALAFVLTFSNSAWSQTIPAGETIWIHRNLGEAYFADDAFAESSKEWAVVAASPQATAADHRNFGVASVLAGNFANARLALQKAKTLEPKSAKTAYALGILSKRESNLAAAQAALLECRTLGGKGAELDYNLGILASRLNDFPTALKEFKAVADLGPNLAPRHYASALYRLGRTQIQIGQRKEGAESLARYQDLIKAGTGAQLSESDLEVGVLLDLTEIPRPVDPRTPGPVPAYRLEPLPVEAIKWADACDIEGDGDVDLLLGDGQTLQDLRNEKGKYKAVTSSRGLSGLLGVTMGRLLDMDNDGTVDLVRGGGGGILVQHGVQGSWDPAVVATKSSCSWFEAVDVDHEGDLDFVGLGTLGVQLLQNNGDRSYADATGGSGLETLGACTCVLAGDLDDDQDVDFVFVTRKGKAVVASNLRGKKFQVLPPIAAAPEGVFDGTLGDFDNDGDLDLALAGSMGAIVLRNDGKLQFAKASNELAITGNLLWPNSGAHSLFSGDFDNDGRLDLLGARANETVLALNQGNVKFTVPPAVTRPFQEKNLIPAAVVLLEGDGKLDFILSHGKAGIARNVGAIGNSFVARLKGAENNEDGVGTILELLSGSRYVRRDARSRVVHFGVGIAGKIDAVRVQWPNGIQQAVIDPKPNTSQEVKEKPGLVGSCPFLYTWNGEKNEFITDILTVTPLGLPVMPGTYVPPNWDEVIRVTSEQMQPTASGMLEARVTEELREVTYLDQVRLYAIDHPSGTEVQPNEKFKFPPFPEFGIHLLDKAIPPVLAIDHRGRDVTEKLLFTDDVVVGDLELTRYGGITQMHTLTVDFGVIPTDAPLTLHLSGWFHWTQASINLALFQDSRHDFIPPFLEVESPDGSWEKLPLEVGFPGGKTKSIPLDVTGVFPSGRARLRITTSLRLYWDRALLQVGKPAAEPRSTMLLPVEAVLNARGHSEPIFSATGESPESFDYNILRKADVPWDQHPGMYTKLGDVTSLVQAAEDQYVIMASGDECVLRWRVSDLPPLETGNVRTYFLFFDGWAKDGDLNTTWATEVEPLPFHGMSGYPYREDESYPTTPAHEEYRRVWNTRPAERLTRDLRALAKAAEALETPPSP